MLVQLKNLTKSFGSQTVLDKINLTVNEKDRLGIVGVNGAGKTTLFNIIAGALEAEAYENATDAVYVRKGLKIGYLRQVEAVESQNTLYGEIRRSFAEIDRIAAQLVLQHTVRMNRAHEAVALSLIHISEPTRP